MHHFLTILLSATVGLAALSAQDRSTDAAPVSFRAVDVLVDSGAEALAAYQLDFLATTGSVKIISIEGGQHAAFKEPPYYDSKAIQQEHAVLAAFNTSPAAQLPSGKTRVATIHVQVTGGIQPQFATRIITAATVDGRPVRAHASLNERNP